MWKNKLKTTILLALISGLFMLIGGLLGGSNGLTFALVFACIMNGVMYFFSDKMALAMYKAKPLPEEDYPHIYAIIDELRHTMHLPMPKLWIIETSMANAFATGRSPAHASIAVTTGILKILDEDELRGVLAHELSHVQNRDILVSTIAATFATAIGYIANMVQHMLFWESIRGDRKRNNANPIGMLIVAIITPLVASIIQLAISRSREYLADETGAHACHDPLALASALQKLHQSAERTPQPSGATAQAGMAALCIVHPFAGRGIMNLFSTHPPVEKRIARLHHISEKGRYS